MNNEEAAEHLRLILDEGLAGDANYDDKGKDAEAVRLAIAALRTPPATGAAQREACAAECDALQHDFKIEADDAQRKGLFNQENDYAMRSYGARACAAAIRTLPVPEVPEAVRNSRYDEMVALLEDAKGVLCNPANYRSGFDPVLKMARAYFKAYGGGL